MLSKRAQIVILALGRLVLGGALLAAPRAAVGASWVGSEEARKPATGLLLRAVGARDIALALGALSALRGGDRLRPWLIGGALADATDFAATLSAGKAVPKQGRIAVALVAGTAAIQQLLLARKADG